MQPVEFILDPDLGTDLIEAAGTEEFGALLLDAARRLGGVDEVFVYSLGGDEPPQTLAVASTIQNAVHRAELYVSRFFRHDPLIHRYRRIAKGSGFGELVRVGEIAPSDYRAHCFAAPGFAEKLSFGWRWDARLVVVSFYSRQLYAIIPERLVALAGLALAAVSRRTVCESTDALVLRFEKRLQRAFPVLSQREITVCARTLSGDNADEIAASLGIRRSSVLTYRQRAYQKIGTNRTGNILTSIFY